MPKLGSLYRGTNWKPFLNYRVNGKWLEDLWADEKLSNDTYMDLSLQVRKGHASRKRDFEAVLAGEQGARTDQRVAAVNVALQQLKAPPRRFPEVTAWEDSFLKLDFRWKILVLCADSSSGKSNFAETLFDNPFLLTVEGSQHLDLKGFDYEKHDGLVLDNVNSWGQILQWRALLQARNAKSKGGQSATNVFSYTQYLYGVPVVATVDLDAPDAHLVDREHEERSKWLCRNCTIVRLPAGDTFYDKSKLPNVVVPNEFSLFAATLKRRRLAETGTEDTARAAAADPLGTPRRVARRTPSSPGRTPGLPLCWEREEEEGGQSEEDENPFGLPLGFDDDGDA